MCVTLPFYQSIDESIWHQRNHSLLSKKYDAPQEEGVR